MNRQVVVSSLIAFIASFCTLVIELVAGRIMAPYVGVSLYTWTSIIGVVLAGISLGAYLGGLLADRVPRYATLGWLLFFSGLSSLLIPVVTDVVGGGDWLRELTGKHVGLPFMVRILLLTTMIFIVPAIILGMISPVVVKLTVNNLEKTGNVVGKIYAFSTLGSILGTFSTGFFLIEFMGTRTILYCVGALLVLCAPIFGGMFRGRSGAREAIVTTSLVLLVGALGLFIHYRDAIARPWSYDWDETEQREVFKRLDPEMYYKESDYYTLKVSPPKYWDKDKKQYLPMRTLVLDHLIHSYTHMENPLHLKYEYLRIYEELVAWRMTKKESNDYFFVGGGGYTLPRFFDAYYPKAKIDVVEIDPWVTKLAEDMLGIKGTRIRSFNQDGRWFAMNAKDKYDFIFGDAFNDLSIPYHLTTVEFDNQLKSLLKPDGLLMALVIDSIKDGEFLPTYIKTMQAAFGEDKVHLITIEEQDIDEIGHETCIVVACQEKLDFEGFKKFLKAREHPDPAHKGEVYKWVSNVVPEERLQSYMGDIKKRGRKPIVLTDDYVPADNLIAKLFNERFSFKKKGAD